MGKKIFAVTGATGNIGGKLTELLLAGGCAVRAIARGGERLQILARKGAEARAGSVDDARFLTGVFKGVDGVFAMVPPDYTAQDIRERQQAVTDAEAAALKAAEVTRVVALSSVGAHHEKGTGPIAGLHYHEQELNALRGTDVLTLRAAFFMENFLQNAGLIRTQGINGGALAPDLTLPMVATKDIAAAAAAHFSDADFKGKSVRYLLGPRDLTCVEVTRVLGQAIGKPDLRYIQFSYDDTRKALLAAGLSRSAADGLVEMYRGFNEKLVRPTEPRSARNTTPTTLEQWSPAFAAAIRSGSGAGPA